MKKTLAMDDEWDLLIKDGKFRFYSEESRYVQDIKTILKTIRGNNIFYPTIGVPWVYIITDKSNNNVIKNAIIDALDLYMYPVKIHQLEINKNKEQRSIEINLIVEINNQIENIVMVI